jgi:dienelactone hydrolase
MGCGDEYVLAVAQNVSLTSGSPQMFSDLQDAITFAQSLEQVNPDKITIWGTSYSGPSCWFHICG